MTFRFERTRSKYKDINQVNFKLGFQLNRVLLVRALIYFT